MKITIQATTAARLYRVATLAIFGGVLMICQPFNMAVFSYGFPMILAGVVGFVILDHLPVHHNDR